MFYMSKSRGSHEKGRQKPVLLVKIPPLVVENRFYTTKNPRCGENGRQKPALHDKKLALPGRRQIEHGFTLQKTATGGKTVDRTRFYLSKNARCGENGRQNPVLHYKKPVQLGFRQIEPGFTRCNRVFVRQNCKQKTTGENPYFLPKTLINFIIIIFQIFFKTLCKFLSKLPVHILVQKYYSKLFKEQLSITNI